MFCQLHIRQQDHSSPKQVVCILEYTLFFSRKHPKTIDLVPSNSYILQWTVPNVYFFLRGWYWIYGTCINPLGQCQGPWRRLAALSLAVSPVAAWPGGSFRGHGSPRCSLCCSNSVPPGPSGKVAMECFTYLYRWSTSKKCWCFPHVEQTNYNHKGGFFVIWPLYLGSRPGFGLWRWGNSKPIRSMCVFINVECLIAYVQYIYCTANARCHFHVHASCQVRKLIGKPISVLFTNVRSIMQNLLLIAGIWHSASSKLERYLRDSMEGLVILIMSQHITRLGVPRYPTNNPSPFFSKGVAGKSCLIKVGTEVCFLW